jgi:hypothetical protein
LQIADCRSQVKDLFTNNIELPQALAGGTKTGNYIMALAKRYIWLKPAGGNSKAKDNLEKVFFLKH